jgi:hypothetical protein
MNRPLGTLWCAAILSATTFGCAREDFPPQSAGDKGSPSSVASQAGSNSNAQAIQTAASDSLVEETAASSKVTVSSLAVPILMNANSDLEQFDLDGFLTEQGLPDSVKDCVQTYVSGPGLELVNAWMVATGVMPGSSNIEAMIVASTQKAILICNRDAVISQMLPKLPEVDPPTEEARCALNLAFDWLATRPDESFILDPWAFDDQSAHNELLAKMAPCQLDNEYTDYLIAPARNPITNERGEIVVPIRSS